MSRLRAWLGEHWTPVSLVVTAAWVVVACFPSLGHVLVLTIRPLGASAAWRWASTGLVHLDTAALVSSVVLWLLLAPALELSWRSRGHGALALVGLLAAGQAAGVLAQLLVDEEHTVLLGGSFLVSAVVGATLSTPGLDRRRRVGAALLLVLELAWLRSQGVHSQISHLGHLAAGGAGILLALVLGAHRARAQSPDHHPTQRSTEAPDAD